ncbi:MAG: hypothetical protein VKI83_04250 [Synechococcaceae cyanobacterium]|nr:hypothetical protein [Synechococcaceae cyanobacterium]
MVRLGELVVVLLVMAALCVGMLLPLLALAFALLAWGRSRQLSRQLLQLQQRLALLESPETRRSGASVVPEPERAQLPPHTPRLAQPSPTPQTPPRATPSTPPAPRRQAVSPAWRQRLERELIEHWTGLLGVVLLVAGVTFLAVNLALRLGPLPRFLLILAVAVAMLLPSLLWSAQQRWRPLCLWLRSGGGALLLFACAASGGWPQMGLQWLHDPVAALALLAAGVAVNLRLAVLSRSETVASLHVVVTLVPLLILQPDAISLALATLVTLLGLSLPRLQHWERHRLLVTLAYTGFQLSWAWRAAAALAASEGLRLQALLLALAVFGAGVLLQHRPRLVPRRGRPLPLALLLGNWGALLLSLLLYSSGPPLRPALLLAAAAAAALLGALSRRRGFEWLRRADILVGQGLAMGAVLSLQPLIVDGPLLLFVLLLECLAFLLLVLREQDIRLQRIGWLLAGLAGLALLLAGALAGIDAWIAAARLPSPLPRGLVAIGQPRSQSLLVLASTLVVLLQRRLRKRPPLQPLPQPQLAGWLAAALMAVGALGGLPAVWWSLEALPALGALLLLACVWRPPGLRPATTVAVGAAHGLIWLHWWQARPWAPLPLLALQLLPLLLLAALLIRCRGRRGRPLAILLIGFSLTLASWLLLSPFSPLAPAVAWLLFSLLALELAGGLERRDARMVLLLGLLWLAAFVPCWLLLISQDASSLTLLGLALPARLLIELFALATVLAWWFLRPPALVRELPLWRSVHPWFLESALLAVVALIVGELGSLWRPPAWALLALLLLAGPMRRWFADRVRLYAVLAYWLSIATVVALLGTVETPATPWWLQPAAIGLATIGLQLGFVVASHRSLEPQLLRACGSLPLIGGLGPRLAEQRTRWLDLPLFAAVAWFLFSRFDHALLTLLWAIEAFVIYGLSGLLRERLYRRLALLALALCLLRLVLIDMEQADLGLRGAVFVGVGVLMVVMNALASRFRERFR